MEQDLSSLPENLSSPRVFDRSLVFCVVYLLATVTSVVVRFMIIRLVTSNLSYVRQLHCIYICISLS
jgi:hypothetical protein